MAKKVYREKEVIICNADGKVEKRTIEAWAIAKGDSNFTKTFDLFHTKILEELGVMNGEAKLLFYLLALTKDLPLNTNGWIKLDYQKAINDLKASRPTLFRYIKKLVKLGYVEQMEAKQKIFRIKPEYVYRGVLSEYWDKALNKPNKSAAIFVGTN